MRILEVEPAYYSKYPPLGLLKLGKMEERKWNEVALVNGLQHIDFKPSKIYITSLFTYAWKAVHDAIAYYHNQFPDVPIYVGGIYATLMPENIKKSFPYVNIYSGLHPEAENLLPAYHLLKQVQKWKDWDSSIVFTSRGCIRKCPFCVVPKVEGGMRDEKPSIMDLIQPSHNKVTIWDNNFLASPYAKSMLKELADNGIEADFNQGLDARLIDEETAGLLADIKSKTIHMAYDWPWEGKYVKNAIDLLANAGYRKKYLIFYTLFNFYDEIHKKGDTPADFLLRLKNLMEWGASSYPMRFIPLDSLDKNKYISPLWNQEQLEMVAKARRVIGFGGSFVPYKAFVDKIIESEAFEEAMYLRPIQSKNAIASKILIENRY
jgi:hypothetical protein